MLYGYARVSTQEQETHAQTDALAKAGVGFIFSALCILRLESEKC
ncbi:hypothetical protein LMG8323_00438 [Ralstonia mannitolilytica]|nr:hypothetical protein LMG8323_00438 [Ralstonia mannitolilytica]